MLPFIPNAPRTLSRLRQGPVYSDDLSGHLRKVRAALNITQAMAAHRIGVSQFTYRLWECGAHQPLIAQWPAIIAFIGRDPNGVPSTMGEQLQAWRRAEGISRKGFARRLGLDAGTLAKLEQDGYRRIDPRVRPTVEALKRHFNARAIPKTSPTR